MGSPFSKENASLTGFIHEILQNSNGTFGNVCGNVEWYVGINGSDAVVIVDPFSTGAKVWRRYFGINSF
jgi:hypothetical protein